MKRTTLFVAALAVALLAAAPVSAIVIDNSRPLAFNVIDDSEIIPCLDVLAPGDAAGGPSPHMIPVEFLGMSIADAPFSLRLLTTDDGGASSHGPHAFIDFVLTAPPEGDFPVDSFFDVFVDLAHHDDGSRAEPRGIDDPNIVPGGDSFFDVFFDVFVDGVGLVQHQLHFEIPQGHPLSFFDVFVSDYHSPSFNVTFGLHYDGTEPGPGQGDTLFGATVTGNVIPEPATMTLLGIAGVAMLRRRR